MASVTMYASISNDLDTQLEKLSLKLIQQPYFKKNRFTITAAKSASLFSIPAANLSNTDTSSSSKSNQKKMVRFADSLGFELVTVKILSNSFINDSFSYYQSEEEDSEEFQSDSNDYPSSDEIESSSTSSSSFKHSDPLLSPLADPNTFIYDNLNFTWNCLFDQPGIMPDFYSRLNKNKVMLEAIYSNHFKLNGVVRVSNMSFHKRVFIRFTLNNWKSYTDSDCSYLMNGTNNDTQTDRFKFSIVLDKTGLIDSIDENLRLNRSNPCCSPVLKLEFAVCYELRSSDDLNKPFDQSFWDNNESKNYHYDCYFKILTPTGLSLKM